MRIVMFYHSLVSDWNHGNAHFLRGIVTELLSRGHEVSIFEPFNGWSTRNLVNEYGNVALDDFQEAYPGLRSTFYDPLTVDLDRVLNGADLVIVHEWNEQGLVKRIGQHRRFSGYRLLFHDTHHRSATAPESMAAYDLKYYDGVLAFGNVIRDIYLSRGWAGQVWTWHEAADTRVFHPRHNTGPKRDLVWIGNWGDEERTQELKEFFIDPVRMLRLRACTYGVRYPDNGRSVLVQAGITYCGWLPNYRVPDVFACFKATVHIPRRPYTRYLRGIPTIRPFEALACGIPLVCSPWDDVEGLFSPGKDYLVARNGTVMRRYLKDLLEDEGMAQELADRGLRTILDRHTCRHRVDELQAICEELGIGHQRKTLPGGQDL